MRVIFFFVEHFHSILSKCRILWNIIVELHEKVIWKKTQFKQQNDFSTNIRQSNALFSFRGDSIIGFPMLFVIVETDSIDEKNEILQLIQSW